MDENSLYHSSDTPSEHADICPIHAVLLPPEALNVGVSHCHHCPITLKVPLARVHHAVLLTLEGPADVADRLRMPLIYPLSNADNITQIQRSNHYFISPPMTAGLRKPAKGTTTQNPEPCHRTLGTSFGRHQQAPQAAKGPAVSSHPANVSLPL